MKLIKYWTSIILSLIPFLLPAGCGVWILLSLDRGIGTTEWVILAASILFSVLIYKPVSKLRQTSRFEAEHDEFGRSKKKGDYTKLSKKERDMIDLQKTAQMETILDSSALKKLTSEGPKDPKRELDALIGLNPIKDRIAEMVARFEFEREGKKKTSKDANTGYTGLFRQTEGHSVLVTHFADLLKFMAKNLYGWQGDKDGPARYEINGQTVNGRGLLQTLGTDIIRAKDPDLWVNFVIKEMKLLGYNWDCVIIPDCRFPNEIDRFKEEGYDTALIKVIRPGFDNGLTEEQKSHPSERAMDDYPADIVILNVSDLDGLKTSCKIASTLIAETDELKFEGCAIEIYTPDEGRVEDPERG